MVGGKISGYTHINEIPQLATGVTNFGGGMALVGENGPEIVNLPRGSNVIPNREVATGGGMPAIQVTQNIYGEMDMDQKLRQLAYAVSSS
jgi:phage-related protein